MSVARDVEVRSPIERLLRFFERLAGSAFFGKVTVSFQNGRVCDVKVEQTKKLDEL
ncbi:MAG: hypothetical protein HY901_36965 [Deltaproteobacteria bacterium]|nr:hypothetical protein [Deltaproteobacteria bacterium]